MGQTQALLLEFLTNSGPVKTKNERNRERNARAETEARKEVRDGAREQGESSGDGMAWRDETRRSVKARPWLEEHRVTGRGSQNG